MSPQLHRVSFSANGWAFLMTLGACLILFGLLVIAVPWLLIWIIGSFFLIAGVSLVSVAFALRRQSKDVRRIFEDFE